VALTILCALVALVLLAPLASDLLSLARIAFGAGRPARPGGPEDQRLLLLVPAHNEELLIDACLSALRGLRYPRGRASVVVIADNCTDRTAALATSAGVACLERVDREHPGKPRAIAWALARLPVADYDAVVIVDADTMVDPDFARELSRAAPLRSAAAQAYFGLSNPDESPLTRMSAVLAAATHRYAYRLKSRAGLNVPLVGNGMAVGTAVLAEYGWDAFSICEDWEMYALLTERGVSIAGVPGARIYAQEARSLSESGTQRERWTAGRLSVLVRVGPRLLASGQTSLAQKLDALAELAAPGPGLHLGAVTVLGAALSLLHPPGAGPLLAALLGSLLRPAIYAATALVASPRPARTLASFFFLPVYAVWRVATAARALRLVRGGPWVRTQRHQHHGA